MSPEEYQLICTIMAEAAELPNERRTAFVAERCAGDQDLERHVHRFLDVAERATDDFGARLERPLVELSAIPAAAPEAHPQQIGPFEIIDKIGEGGHGVVYRARQTEPVARIVAVKILSSAATHRRPAELVQRFRAEYHALERLRDHPLIPDLYTAGVTAEGRHWYAMEYVEGVPLHKYCATNELALAERLRLFVEICDAASFAHDRDIIHRDLKPSNIIVTECDGVAVPKIIDFGLARSLFASLTADVALTQLGEPLGTLEYMSPEQAEGAPVDSRTDVYSLGVILYELVTGRVPIPADSLRSSQARTISTAIREIKPPPPATLEPAARGELQWIILHALEKTPADRYPSARALGDDVNAHLKGEVVTAHPPRFGYRLGKVIRRRLDLIMTVAIGLCAVAGAYFVRSFGFVAAALSGALVIAGGVAIAWGLYDRARRAERAARNTRRELQRLNRELASLRIRLHKDRPQIVRPIGEVVLTAVLFLAVVLFISPTDRARPIDLSGYVVLLGEGGPWKDVEEVLNRAGETLEPHEVVALRRLIPPPRGPVFRQLATIVEPQRPAVARRLRAEADGSSPLEEVLNELTNPPYGDGQ